MYTVSVDKAIV